MQNSVKKEIENIIIQNNYVNMIFKNYIFYLPYLY